MNKDLDVQRHIEELVAQEHALLEKAEHHLTADERTRLEDLNVQLDRYWDLLRQRRARRDAGQDPGQAHMRSAEVVEHYRQ